MEISRDMLAGELSKADQSVAYYREEIRGVMENGGNDFLVDEVNRMGELMDQEVEGLGDGKLDPRASVEHLVKEMGMLAIRKVTLEILMEMSQENP